MKYRWSQDKFQAAFCFAAAAHGVQQITGTDLPYITHVTCVCAELMCVLHDGLDCDLALQCAALHDTVEDTQTTVESLRAMFGERVADGVAALTKDRAVEKALQISDSLARISKQPKEIWMVKLADRIVNLSRPPTSWSQKKITNYRQQSELILEHLKMADGALAGRLVWKIEQYKLYER